MAHEQRVYEEGWVQETLDTAKRAIDDLPETKKKAAGLKSPSSVLRDLAVQAHLDHLEHLDEMRRDAQQRTREEVRFMLRALVGDIPLDLVDDPDSCDIIVSGVPLYVSDCKLWARGPSRLSPTAIHSLADLGEVFLEWEAAR